MIKDNLRRYGRPPYTVVVVHGGPGAPGEMKPVAEELSSAYGVLEPLQTKDSVSGQVEELRQIILQAGQVPIVLIGWSWGAWLSFMLASQYPFLVKKLILVSSGPFEAAYAERIMPLRLSRLSEAEQGRAQELKRIGRYEDDFVRSARFAEIGALISKADSYCPLAVDSDEGDPRVVAQPNIFERVWREAEALRRSGKLLAYGERISSPVTVIHGDYDPHPFEGVQVPLSKVLKNCNFVLLAHCGHHPWYEVEAREAFYRALKQEIACAT